MLRRNRRLVVALFVAGSILGSGMLAFFGSALYRSELRVRLALQGCGSEPTDSGQNACIFRVIDAELRRGGVAAAMQVFSLAYEEFPSFADDGCHKWAHHVGDMTYYEMFVGTLSLDSIDFPQSTTACGYGFFHGFLEHYVQDRPDITSVTKICDYLGGKLEGRMRDIVTICYHGAGHGFTLAQTAQLKRSEWGNISALVTVPAQKCLALPKASAGDKEQCYEGIFNIVDEYMQSDNYGFSYDEKEPLTPCATQPAFLHRACIYEMAQQLGHAAGEDARVIEQLSSVLPVKADRTLAFGIGITDIIQQHVASGDGYDKALSSCATLSNLYFKTCVRSIVGGLFEEGDPQREYQKPLAFCENPEVQARAASDCYQRIIEELPRFYTSDRIKDICPQIPSAYRASCIAEAMGQKMALGM